MYSTIDAINHNASSEHASSIPCTILSLDAVGTTVGDLNGFLSSLLSFLNHSGWNK